MLTHGKKGSSDFGLSLIVSNASLYLRILVFPIPFSCSYLLYSIVEFNPHLILASALGPQTLCGGHHANCLGHFESNPSSPPDPGRGRGYCSTMVWCAPPLFLCRIWLPTSPLIGFAIHNEFITIMDCFWCHNELLRRELGIVASGWFPFAPQS